MKTGGLISGAEFQKVRASYGFKPDELEQSLVLMLQDEYPESATKPSTPVTQATAKPIGH
jgi:hypothetical protein